MEEKHEASSKKEPAYLKTSLDSETKAPDDLALGSVFSGTSPEQIPDILPDEDTLKNPSASENTKSYHENEEAVVSHVAPPTQKKSPLVSEGNSPTSQTFHVAGFGRRFSATIIDLIICVPIGLFLAWIANKMAGVHLPPTRATGIDYILSLDYWLDLILSANPAFLSIVILVSATFLLYVFLFQLTIGRTIGMRTTKTQLIDIYGDSPDQWRLGLRTLGYLFCALTLNLGFFWIAFDSEKRGLHDWIAGTYVIKSPV